MENENGIPRRNNLQLNELAELAIYNAMQEVEKLDADERLTKAVALLSEAKNLVSDFVDERLCGNMATLGSNR